MTAVPTKGLNAADIAVIENELGCELPEDVREQYAKSDGLRGPINCSLLYPLHGEPNLSILACNKLKLEDWFPESYKRFALLGDDGCGNWVCYDPTTKTASLWNPEDGERLQETRGSVSEIWDLIHSQFEELE